MRVIRLLSICAAALLLGAAPMRASRADVVLAVAGSSNQTPAAASLGSFVAVAWSAEAPQGSDVYLAVSRDSALTFADPVRVNALRGEARVGGELPPRTGLTARPGSADPEIVVVYGSKTVHTEIKLARSLDGGRTFTPGRPLQAAGAAGDRGWHAMALDAAGTAHVLWLDHRGLAAAKGAATHAGHEADALDGVAMAQRSGLYYARDDAHGNAPERELVKGVCYCCKVAMAAGRDGSLFAAWRQVYPGNVRDIAFIASHDLGRTFTAPARVSADEWQLAGCPDDGPAMGVDGEGTVHVVWPTVLGGPEPEGAIFYASSRDGRTFSPRARVPTLGSSRPMHPQILVDQAAGISVAWDEVVNGVRQAAVRTLRFDEAGRPRFGTATRLGTSDTPSSYPVLVATSRGPVALFVSGVPGATVIRASRP
ncbi:MAG: hypothetical protein IT180_15340 [Acidobacteria bacterium]|nr:hypothetical protein [Acidobacteriota bacterium]